LGSFANFLSRAGMGVLVTFKAWATPVAFGASAIVDDPEGRVILVRHSYQTGWHLPGGGVGPAEPPAVAILRELREEIGLVRSEPPVLVGIFTRKLGWVTNVIALYRVKGAVIAFKPNFEIREIAHADPANPPEGTVGGARRRHAELIGKAAPSPYW
jgi:8-oxo-dGTP pyrophosphatase MutT (NUDIX family)